MRSFCAARLRSRTHPKAAEELLRQGAAHKQLFQVECQIPQLAIRTTGFGASRRIAEQEAAQLAFGQMRK